ncbi:MAG TPA: apolipoprotein N-acyltransferase [Stellaceae bacterium]|nr:apolipoprotein N-acyltransferase [Stellaceae bacterium]
MPEAGLFRVRPGATIDTPLCRLAGEIASLRGWRRYGLAFALGIAAVAALPPVDLTPVLVIVFPLFLWLDDGSSGLGASFRLGWVFGFGFFIAGLYWIAAALFVDIDRFWWLVPFAAAGLPAAFALYIGLALLATRLVARLLRLPATARIVAFAIAWSVAEWVRGHALTGLPWNLVGYAWSGGFPGSLAMLQSTAWIGIYGLSFLTVLAASLPALLGVSSLAPVPVGRRWAPVVAAGLLIGGLAIAGAVRLQAMPSVLTGTWLRLVQPSIPQTLKWQPEAARSNFQRLLDLSAAPSSHALSAVLWPEAASPYLLGRDSMARQAIAGVVPPGGYLITGTLRANPPPAPIEKIWNSIAVIDGKGDILAHYDKAHLVPFGEYVPFRRWLSFTKVTAGSIDLSAGPGPRTITVPGLPPFGALVCYEVIFPHAIVDENSRPAWLLNVTDDAWYGRTSGPFQHFAIARTRAVEEGLPLVRVANNGISAVVDAAGRVLARTNLDAIGYVDAALPAAAARTPYARGGDWIFLALLVAGAVPVALRLG